MFLKINGKDIKVVTRKSIEDNKIPSEPDFKYHHNQKEPYICLIEFIEPITQEIYKDYKQKDKRSKKSR